VEVLCIQFYNRRNITLKFFSFLSIAIFFVSLCGVKHDVVRLTPNTESKDFAPIHLEQNIVRASWYGPGFFGRRLADGKRYQKNAVFVAHRHYPMGTKLRVTNLRNQRTIIAVVEDRGPYVTGRSLDLSYRAACELDMIESGTALVSYKALP
jgi:3D (Asp-Asp-Asp) domain-containing protein